MPLRMVSIRCPTPLSSPRPRILSDNLGDGVLDGLRVCSLAADGCLANAAENQLLRPDVYEINYQRALGVLLHIGIHRPCVIGSNPADRHAVTGHDVEFLPRPDKRNDVETGICASFPQATSGET